MAGLQYTHEDFLSARPSLGAVAAPGFSSNDSRPERPFGGVVCGVDARTVKKDEQPGLLMSEVVGEPLIGRKAIGFGQQTVHPGFQPSGGNGQTVRGDFLTRITIPQFQCRLEHFQYFGGKLRGRRRDGFDQLFAAGESGEPDKFDERRSGIGSRAPNRHDAAIRHNLCREWKRPRGLIVSPAR